MKIIAVTNGQLKENSLIKTIEQIEHHIDFVIIREKQKSRNEYLSFLNHLNESAVNKEKLIVHRDAEAACNLGIRRVHLPEHGISLKEVKNQYKDMITGRSVHSLEAAKKAEDQGADYVMYGHIFETKSKAGIDPRGLVKLEKLTSALKIPVIAIGGITPAKIKDLKQAGAQGAAVMSGIFESNDPLETVSQYKKEATYV